MPRILFIMIAAVLLITSPVYAGPIENQTSSMLLDEIHKALSTIRSLEVNFIQTRHLSIFEDELKSEGKLYYILPDKMRWEVKKPYRSALILNQNKVAKFEFQNGALRKMDLAGISFFTEIMGQMMHIMKGDFSAIEKEYAINAEQREKVIVTLTPRSHKLATILSSLTFTMRPETFSVTKLTFQEGNEDLIEIVFQNEKRNEKLEPSLFSITNPSGFVREMSE